jgi:RNA polymerase sigma-70 factor (ECF subfamily)
MDKAEFEQIVRENSEPLYWQIRRMVTSHEDANDVLQNTFLKAWKRIDDFHGDSTVFTWLSRIAINESVDFMRHNKHYADPTEDVMTLADSLLADPYFDGSETEALFQEAVASLPEVQRTVFTLRYYDEMKYSDISKLLNTSVGSLKASYHIAVKKIYEFFKARN